MEPINLLAPGRIGPLRTRNRIVMPAMDQNTCDEGAVTDLTIAHYEARAEGRVGLLILETSAVAWPVGATSRHQPALSDDRFVPGLRRLAEAVHAHGSKMIVQACHHGKTAGVDAQDDRAQLVPSVPLPPEDYDISAITVPELMKMAALTGGKQPTQHQATLDDIAWVVDSFADAAARVQAAGLDGIEVHAAHGYLIAEFLSPRFNRRDDEYGGTVERRARLLVEVVAAIRARCGDDFAVIVRLDGSEHVEGGITPDLAARHARLAEEAGAHAVHVSASAPNAMGTGFTLGPLPWKPEQYVDYARTVKAAVSIPVIAVGRIMPEAGDRLIGEGVCDFVSMGRQLLADPEIPARLAAGRPDLVRTCINCYVCVAQNFWDGTPVCAVNAELGHYDEGPLPPADPARHVVVVGGGPGGMEAARVAVLRGHRVTLLERSPHLGGTARFSSLTTPMNAELVRYLSAAIAEAGVDVRLDTSADAATLRTLSPDAVVVATGARRERPPVPGAHLPHVLSGDDLRALLTGGGGDGARGLRWHERLAVGAGRRLGLTDDMARVRELSRRWMPFGDDVVVWGGGLVGVELAEFLAERDRRVTVLEAGEKLGVEMAHPRRARALHEARELGVVFVSGAELVGIDERAVTYRVADEERTAVADQVILAGGVVPDTGLADAVRAAGFEVHVVGDAGEVGYIQGAVRSGYLVGRSL
ncbi:FAD-dependent oxidoreductase [Rhabdothermincola salaria]|uniref:oxidoreductase n=1 Tax=Rhabdothermincola salaria TaxID=2903142 RepID=UPI001E58013F|nr:FAD-dependent oxidoreductase [Rhabdothermincola salaria]MCD9624372.1 NAD(P)/FAD-dependent oxidoreductase [Rhabdothermincola salaria]